LYLVHKLTFISYNVTILIYLEFLPRTIKSLLFPLFPSYVWRNGFLFVKTFYIFECSCSHKKFFTGRRDFSHFFLNSIKILLLEVI